MIKSWTRPTLESWTWTRPSLENWTWTRPSLEGWTWTRPSLEGWTWTRPSLEGWTWTRPSLDGWTWSVFIMTGLLVSSTPGSQATFTLKRFILNFEYKVIAWEPSFALKIKFYIRVNLFNLELLNPLFHNQNLWQIG